MRGKGTWATALVLAVLTRLLATEGGPIQHTKQRHHSASQVDELIENPEREIDGTYRLLKKRSHGPLQALDSTGAAAGADGSARQEEPKYHFEVHAVQHKNGHLVSADEKLESVMRQAAGLSQQPSLPTANIDIPVQRTDNENRVVPLVSADDMAAVEEKKSESDGILNPHHSSLVSPEEEQDTPVALARQDPGRVDGPNAGVHAASSIADVYFLAVVAGCSVAGIAGLLLAAVCWYRLHKKIKAASEVDYPAYGVTGPAAAAASTKDSRGAGSPGDRKLAQSAQMYHYQHQKQQMIASERLASDIHPAGGGSDVESEEENEEGDYTVFECPGQATNGEMEVRNPLFSDQTPASTPADVNSQQKKK